MSTAPWEVRIHGVGETNGLHAVVDKTVTHVKPVGDAWEGTASLHGAIVNKGLLEYDAALVVLLIFLVNRSEEADLDYWYVDEGLLVVRVEPVSVSREIDEEGTFEVDAVLRLTVMSTPDGVSEQDVINEVMEYIFSDLSGEVTDEGSG